MRWFFEKDGTVSGFRVAIAIAVFGIVFVVLGALIFQVEQANARQPFNIDVPEGVTLLKIDDSRYDAGARYVFYTSQRTPEDIAEYYDRKLAEFQNIPVEEATRERCRRIPRDGTIEGYQPGNGTLPYYWTCLFDNTRLFDQSTIIRIYPGQRNDATGENFEGLTRIDYEQFWQAGD